MSKIKVSKDPNKNWDNNEIQFARFIVEAEMSGGLDLDTIDIMARSMDLSFNETTEILNRAKKVWDDVKDQL